MGSINPCRDDPIQHKYIFPHKIVHNICASRPLIVLAYANLSPYYLYPSGRKTQYNILLAYDNINLLNHDSHWDTGAFIDLLSSFSFVPLITRPTRVTATTATLIDNVLTNNVENINHSDQGILVTDVTDYYPVFHIHRIP